MPDPIIAGCSPRPPVAISPMPPVNSRGEPQLFGCVPQSTRPARQTGAQARSEISKRCQKLGLSNATTGSLLKSVKLNGDGNTAAGPGAKAARQMLASLESAVARNPRLSTLERDQYATLWTKLGKRSGAQTAWTGLGQQKHFWGRLSGKNRRVAAWQLANNSLSPALIANAYGQDWYKQCLSMILSNSARNACRSTFKMVGVHKGADAVCGKD